MKSPREELEHLHRKYREMHRLRAEHDHHVRAGRTYSPVRSELQALSQSFPGALAEIDRIPPALLTQRQAELVALLDRDPLPSSTTWPSWMRGWIGVHEGLRGALAIKAWLAGRRTVDPEMHAALGAIVPSWRFSEEAARWLDELPSIASPPKGRLLELVYARVARELSIDVETLRSLLMPRSIT